MPYMKTWVRAHCNGVDKPPPTSNHWHEASFRTLLPIPLTCLDGKELGWSLRINSTPKSCTMM